MVTKKQLEMLSKSWDVEFPIPRINQMSIVCFPPGATFRMVEICKVMTETTPRKALYSLNFKN